MAAKRRKRSAEINRRAKLVPTRVVDKAVDLFGGNRPAAARWLNTPQPALAGQIPLDLARTDAGARDVEDLIGRLEHGVFS